MTMKLLLIKKRHCKSEAKKQKTGGDVHVPFTASLKVGGTSHRADEEAQAHTQDLV
jgi:hypothetical protein